MELIALVQPSRGLEPGHMVIAQESPKGSSYYGFHFDPLDLPVEYQLPEHWQEYLFTHKTAGYIRDDFVFVRRAHSVNAGAFLEKRVVCDVNLDSVMPPREEWNHFAEYSFSPDDFHSNASPCYNCVTWAIMIGNQLAPGFLEPVRQGRIKLIKRQIRSAQDQSGDTDG